MTKEDLIYQAKRIKSKVDSNFRDSLTQGREFLKNYAGENSSFYDLLMYKRTMSNEEWKIRISTALDSFIDYVNNDLLRTVSLEREIQIETVSDYLEQAESLLNDKKVHAAAPAVIIGASLEEFLRNWLEEENVNLSTIKLNLDSYAKELRSRDLITKQDLKDITSWGGTRNDAAHGHWENVNDKKRIRLMLEGVNLFMRKYSE